jgi:hypothetical protein
MPVNILTGVVTFSGQRHCRADFMASLANLSYAHLDFLFVTNSGEQDRQDLWQAARPLRDQGRPVTVEISPPAADAMGSILANRRALRRMFLAGEWEWLFAVDSDILPPPHAVETLLGHGEDTVTGVCLGGFAEDDDTSDTSVVRPVIYAPDKPGYVRQMLIAELIEPAFFPVALAGLGCCLLHRDVLAAVDFRLPSPQGGEDTAFFRDARTAGFTLWCDTRVKCRHQKYPGNDPRNDLLDMTLYRLRIPGEE